MGKSPLLLYRAPAGPVWLFQGPVDFGVGISPARWAARDGKIFPNPIFAGTQLPHYGPKTRLTSA
jgi:hypothetical protein